MFDEPPAGVPACGGEESPLRGAATPYFIPEILFINAPGTEEVNASITVHFCARLLCHTYTSPYAYDHKSMRSRCSSEVTPPRRPMSPLSVASYPSDEFPEAPGSDFPTYLWVNGSATTAIGQASDITNLYDLVRVKYVDVIICPNANVHETAVDTVTTGARNIPVLYMAEDKSDNDVLILILCYNMIPKGRYVRQK